MMNYLKRYSRGQYIKKSINERFKKNIEFIDHYDNCKIYRFVDFCDLKRKGFTKEFIDTLDYLFKIFGMAIEKNRLKDQDGDIQKEDINNCDFSWIEKLEKEFNVSSKDFEFFYSRHSWDCPMDKNIYCSCNYRCVMTIIYKPLNLEIERYMNWSSLIELNEFIEKYSYADKILKEMDIKKVVEENKTEEIDDDEDED